MARASGMHLTTEFSVPQENKLSDLDGLKTLSQLTWLDVSHNRLSSVQGLQHMQQLAGLGLEANSISSVQGCPSCTHPCPAHTHSLSPPALSLPPPSLFPPLSSPPLSLPHTCLNERRTYIQGPTCKPHTHSHERRGMQDIRNALQRCEECSVCARVEIQAPDRQLPAVRHCWTLIF